MKGLIFILAALALGATVPAAAAPPPTAFTAHYQLLKNGKPMGKTVMKLRPHEGAWLFTTDTRGTRGLAGFAGLTIHEASSFRMHAGQPEVVSYRYRLDAGPVRRRHTLDVDWQTRQASSSRDDKKWRYQAVPGMVDKHMLPWVLGRGLDRVKATLQATVAVRDRAETQHYLIVGNEDITVPIGRVTALRMDRNDPDRDFTAWYVPGRYAVPVRLDHDQYSLQLTAYSTR